MRVLAYSPNDWQVDSPLRNGVCLSKSGGAPGSQGEPGAQGPAGADGTDGTDGTDGEDGQNGEDGAPGLPGADGQPGLPGAQGPQGEPGTPGAQGEPGVNTGALAGLVTEAADGQLVEGATIAVEPAAVAPVTTDANGEFALPALPRAFTPCGRLTRTGRPRSSRSPSSPGATRR
jgi:hypothetical protein